MSFFNNAFGNGMTQVQSPAMAAAKKKMPVKSALTLQPAAPPAPTATVQEQTPFTVATPQNTVKGDDGFSHAPDSPDLSIDNLSQNFAQQAFAAANGPVDTSAQEALIKQLMQDQTGQGLANARASMGRAGFASSGAEAALSGDVRRKASQQAAQDILGVQTDEKQRLFQNALGAGGLDIAERNAANQGKELDARMQVLQGLLGGQSGAGDRSPGTAPPADAPPGSHYDERGNLIGADGNFLESNPNHFASQQDIQDARGSYPGGAAAWDAAQATGHQAGVAYSIEHGGDMQTLPAQAPTPTSVLVTGNGSDGSVYYDPKTGQLFRSGAQTGAGGGAVVYDPKTNHFSGGG